MNAPSRRRAVALVSSGLDSLLAARIVQSLGIEVIGLHCYFRFDPTAPRPQDRLSPLFDPLGIPLIYQDITDPFLRLVYSPPHGHGQGVNPCIDCKILMLQEARRLLESLPADFVVTGEVVGQRPMSQRRPVLSLIEREANLDGLVLRPLTAKCLPPSIPEKKGWVDRERLYGIAGRSREGQFLLAKAMGITEFNQPAGGCLLTDPQYAARARALFGRRKPETLTPEDMQLLRLGRHLWLEGSVHVVVGRDERENGLLEPFRRGRWAFEPVDVTGPLVLAESIRDLADIETVARITARYCGRKKGERFRIRYQGPERSGEVMATPIEEERIPDWRIA